MGFEVVRDTSLFLIREGVRGAVMVSAFMGPTFLLALTMSPRP